MFRHLLLLTIGANLLGCASLGKAPAASPQTVSRTGEGRVLIRSGSLDLRAPDLEAVKAQVEEIVAVVDGRVSDWSLQDDRWLNMKLRVPEPELDSTMDNIAALGKVVGRSLKSKDVTEELIDLEARLRNLRALRDRLRQYLEQAANLEEILGVERELARVQTEIESIEAKLKVLRDQVALSELDVRVTKKKRW